MTGVVSELMDLVESTGAYQVIVQGLVYLAGENTYVWRPPDVETNPPKTFQLPKLVAASVFNFTDFDGIQYGTRCKRTQAMPSASWGKLVVWHSSQRASYVVKDVSPATSITLASHTPWQDSSFLMYFKYRAFEDADTKDLARVPMDIDLGDSGLPSPSQTSRPGAWRSSQ